MKTIRTGSDFSGVGAFEYALNRSLQKRGIQNNQIFACDWDKYARKTFVHNHGDPKYFPKDVNEREIPKDSLDIYMTSPPCQDFSVSGKRPEESEKTNLFLNSYQFIKENNPRFFIFENVKGLLSHNEGTTFQSWINFLGGKSVNGLPVLFPQEESVNYHLYYKVLNSKNHGVPQNRERIFLVGVRDDIDNDFRFPKEEPLQVHLKDVLEEEVDKSFYLSKSKLKEILFDGKITTKALIKSATKRGFEIASEGDSINYTVPGSSTRRGRVGKGVAQTLDTTCFQAVFILGYSRCQKTGKVVKRRLLNHSNTIHTVTGGGGNTDQFAFINEVIRKLTPRECFRLQGFPDSFDFSVVSNNQAYKQAGNSITVNVLKKIIDNLKL